jgi:hypothetical protein
MTDESKTGDVAPYAEWVGAIPSDEGKHLLLRFEAEEFGTVTLAIPEEQGLDAAIGLIAADGQARLRQGHSPSDIATLETDWWNVEAHPNQTHLVLSFRLPGALRLGFLVHRGQAEGLITGIAVAAGLPVPTAPPGPKH